MSAFCQDLEQQKIKQYEKIAAMIEAYGRPPNAKGPFTASKTANPLRQTQPVKVYRVDKYKQELRALNPISSIGDGSFDPDVQETKGEQLREKLNEMAQEKWKRTFTKNEQLLNQSEALAEQTFAP